MTDSSHDADTIEIYGFRCLNCYSIVYSRAEGDARRCRCGDTYVAGGPVTPRLTDGTPSHTPRVRVQREASLEDLYEDFQYGYGHFRIKHFPLTPFRYVGNDLFPIRVRRVHKRGGVEQVFEAKLTLVSPRNAPEHAPTVMNARVPDSTSVMVWAHDGFVWGRIAYIISNVTDEEAPVVMSHQVSRMKLCPLQALIDLENGTRQLQEFRAAWEAILGRYINEVRTWFDKPVQVEELMWMDILAHKSSHTQNAYNRNLEAKRRMGRLLPSINKPKEKAKPKSKAKSEPEPVKVKVKTKKTIAKKFKKKKRATRRKVTPMNW